MSILIGWDIAQTTDASIVAVIAADGNPAMYRVRRIVKLLRGMPYDQQVVAAKALYFQYKDPKLLIDRTGIGLAICDMIVASGLNPVQVAVTSGDLVTYPASGKVNLPKKDFVAAMTKVIQERRIKVVRGCENAALFRSELKNFQLQVTASGHNTYSAAGTAHDDTIVAVGLCLWYGEKGGRRDFTKEPTIEQAVGDSSPEESFGLEAGNMENLFGDGEEQRGGPLPEGTKIPGMFH
jgi:hypothetical protein